MDKFNDKKHKLIVKSGRESYAHFDDNYDIQIFNPKRKIMTSIEFLRNTSLVIMIFKDHNGGTIKLILCTCIKAYYIISSAHPGKLCHTIIKTLTIKPLKPGKYSNTFQMHKQQENFNGIDTCSIKITLNLNYFSNYYIEARVHQ